MTTPTPMQANLFHSGNTCPFCQETIDDGQMIVTCGGCSSTHHDRCWQLHHGCSSYHCDDRVNTGSRSVSPEVVIRADELSQVIVPATIKRPSPSDVAREYAPPAAEKVSVNAIVSLILAIGAAGGFVGVFTDIAWLLGIGVALVALLCGIIALVRIQNNGRISGTGLAGCGVLCSCVFLIAFVACLDHRAGNSSMETKIELQLNARISEEELDKIPQEKANLLRANVAVRTRHRGMLSAGTSYGSGVITRLAEQRAYIITDKHVIGLLRNDEETDITVMFYNGEESMASVEWLAPGDVDIAVISCPALTMTRLLPVYALDDTLSPSDKVFAIGNPMNLFWSYTQGVISSVRTQDVGEFEIKVCQTQTPINQGNSGGGLYAEDGTLAGISTWTHDKAATEGLSFAITTMSILRHLGDDTPKYMSVKEKVELEEER